MVFIVPTYWSTLVEIKREVKEAQKEHTEIVTRLKLLNYRVEQLEVYSTSCCYEVHHSPLSKSGEGVGGGVHVTHSIKNRCILAFSPDKLYWEFTIDKIIPTSEPRISTILLRELIAKPGPRFSAAI